MNAQARILLVEDVVPYREYVRGLLSEFGFAEIIEADDGGEALEILSLGITDLVISDFSMKRLSGLELLRATRGELQLKQLPFVMMTAVGDDATLAQAERHGVTVYLRKPLHVALFKECIEGALSGEIPTELCEKYRHLRH